jgi:ribose 5-phosphate isomerase A
MVKPQFEVGRGAVRRGVVRDPALWGAAVTRVAEAAAGLGLPIEDFDRLDRLDIAIDGADQVAPDRWVVKGGGGAHLREKVVAAAAERFVVVVDESKLVDSLAPPLPLELVSFGLAATLRRLAEIGEVERRDAPPSPDGGVIADLRSELGDPAELGARLDADPGVAGHGLFASELVSDVLVGTGDGRVTRVT